METRASYLLVGSFVLVFTFGALFFAVWLAKVQFDKEFTRYDIPFTGNVSGLRVGSPVTYRGLPVGEVVDVSIDPGAGEQVRAMIEISADTPVRTDTVASLVLSGIAGTVNVLLSGGDADMPLLTGEDGRRPEIQSRASALNQVIEGAPELVTNLNRLVGQANVVLGAENQVAFAAILQNLNAITGALADGSADIQLLLNDGAGTMANLRDTSAGLVALTDRLNESSEELLSSSDRALDAVAGAAGSIRDLLDTNGEATGAAIASFGETSDEIRTLVKDNREALTEFSNSALIEFTLLVTDTRDLVTRLSRLATEVERDPARFLFGDQQQGYEADE